MHRRLALAVAALGLLLAPAACDIPPLYGNECVSDTDCEGAGRCVDDTCVPQCYLDSDCGDAGPGAVCQFNHCLVPVTVVDAGADAAVDGGPDALADGGPDASTDMAAPDMAPADMAADDMAAADMAAADMANPDMAGEDMASPDMANPDMAGDDMAVDLGPDAAAP